MQGLPVSSYLDPARATLEAATVFASSWQFVCHATDLPAAGTAARFDCAGRSTVVVRTSTGALHAFRNACRHRGARLVEGDLHTGLAFCVDGRLRCPYHGWTYDEAGALVSVPATQQFGADFDAGAHALHPAHVAQWRGLVFVACEQPAQALSALLDAVAGNWPDLSALRRVIEPRSIACAANWKIAAEHLLDAAHYSVARPGLKPRLFGPPTFVASGAAAIAGTATLAAEATADTWSARTYRAILRSQDRTAERAEYVFLWPNLLLQRAPDGLAVLQVLPGAAGQCTYRELRYAVPDAARPTRLLRYLHHRVRHQALSADVRLLARVQQGLANLPDAETGPMPVNEPGLQWFAARYGEHFPTASAPAKPALARRRARPRSTSPAGA